VSTWKEFADNALKTPEVSRELEAKAMEEARSGAAIWVPKLVWVTRTTQDGQLRESKATIHGFS
jgi:hypothetical protein